MSSPHAEPVEACGPVYFGTPKRRQVADQESITAGSLKRPFSEKRQFDMVMFLSSLITREIA